MEELPEKKILFSLGSLDLDMGELPEKKILFFIGFPGPRYGRVA